MRSYEQLARQAYEAYRQQVLAACDKAPFAWEELHPIDREGWIAATQQLWSSFNTTL